MDRGRSGTTQHDKQELKGNGGGKAGGGEGIWGPGGIFMMDAGLAAKRAKKEDKMLLVYMYIYMYKYICIHVHLCMYI